MLMQLLEIYLWISTFTVCSIILEWPFTGSKTDYHHLQARICMQSRGSVVLEGLTYIWVLFCAGLLWWVLYYYRLKDYLS